MRSRGVLARRRARRPRGSGRRHRRRAAPDPARPAAPSGPPARPGASSAPSGRAAGSSPRAPAIGPPGRPPPLRRRSRPCRDQRQVLERQPIGWRSASGLSPRSGIRTRERSPGQAREADSGTPRPPGGNAALSYIRQRWRHFVPRGPREGRRRCGPPPAWRGPEPARRGRTRGNAGVFRPREGLADDAPGERHGQLSERRRSQADAALGKRGFEPAPRPRSPAGRGGWLRPAGRWPPARAPRRRRR